VRKLLKGFLIAAGGLLALAGIGLLAMNLYLQSAGTQKRIEQALSRGLKVPVHVTSMIVTPWSGLKASGITVPQGAGRPGDFLEAESFTVYFGWMALLGHRLDASEVLLVHPRVTWFQDNGHWELPGRVAAQGAPGPKPSPATTPAPPPAHPWTVSVHTLIASGVSSDFWDDKGHRTAQVAGLQFQCTDPGAAGTQGQAECGHVSLFDKLFFKDMRTQWSFGDGIVKLASFQTGVAGGEIHGDAQVDTTGKHSPFHVNVKFDSVDLDQLMTGAGVQHFEVENSPTPLEDEERPELTGTLKGWLDLSGNTAKVNSLNGSWHLEMTGGQFKGIELLEMLGQGLQIPALSELKLDTAEVDARMAGGETDVDNLVLQAQNLKLTAYGTIADNGRLKLEARLTIYGEHVGQVPDFIMKSFKQGSTPDSKYIDFEIGNTLKHPKTRLLETLLGTRIQSQMSDLLKEILVKKHVAPEQTGPAP